MSDPVGERGCASNFLLPISPSDLVQARNLATIIRENNRGLPQIVYRERSGDYDLRHHVFRWEMRDPTFETPQARDYMDVFENAFRARPQGGTRDNVYYNLLDHVNYGGRVLGTSERTPHAFISTTLSNTWCPPSQETDPGRLIRYGYRYEIYAPGGIYVSATLAASDRPYRYPEQDEVCFVGGIARQFIRSVQCFQIIGGSSGTIMARSTSDIILNTYFGPPMLLRIQNPIIGYEENGQRYCLNPRYFPPRAAPDRQKREVSTIDWYAVDVANCESYIDAAFRSSRENEAYLFMKNEYVLVNYAPGTTDDRVVNGPLRISEGFPSLRNTAFAEYGIDSAFRCHTGYEDGDSPSYNISNQAFIFSGNLCAHIDYAPGTTDDKIIKGPMTITDMFPFFKGKVFESGVDAAFEATASYEAYLFKGNQYALINYSSDNPKLIAIRLITQGFGGLINTIFESGIDAAFASHRTDEAYLFKDDSYALINFAPGTTDDYIIGGVKKILPNWPSFRGILPHKNRGLDGNFPTVPDPNPGHDEL